MAATSKEQAVTGQMVSGRERRRRLRVLAIARGELGLSQADIAEALGIDRRIITDIEARRRPLTLERLEALAESLPELAQGVLRRLGEQWGLIVQALPPPREVGGDRRLLSELLREVGEACSALAETLEDDAWSTSEAARVEREGLDAAAVFMAVVHRAREVLRQGAQGVRR